MRRLIDLEKVKPIDFPSTEMDGLDVVRYLNTLPTVDAVEVERGRWIDTPDEMTKYKCDNPKCGFPSFVPWNYCPNCGAKKDGVSDG